MPFHTKTFKVLKKVGKGLRKGQQFVFTEKPFVEAAKAAYRQERKEYFKQAGLAAVEVATIIPAVKALRVAAKAPKFLPVAERLAVGVKAATRLGRGKTVFHGTSIKAAKAIEHKGFRVSSARLKTLPGVYVSERVATAAEYTTPGKEAIVVARLGPKVKLAPEKTLRQVMRRTEVRPRVQYLVDIETTTVEAETARALKLRGFRGARGDIYFPGRRPTDIVVFEPKHIKPVTGVGKRAAAIVGVAAAGQVAVRPPKPPKQRLLRMR